MCLILGSTSRPHPKPQKGMEWGQVSLVRYEGPSGGGVRAGGVVGCPWHDVPGTCRRSMDLVTETYLRCRSRQANESRFRVWTRVASGCCESLQGVASRLKVWTRVALGWCESRRAGIEISNGSGDGEKKKGDGGGRRIWWKWRFEWRKRRRGEW